MRRTTTLTAAGLLGLALLTPTGGTAAGESCQREPATLVGTPDRPLVGTDGRDVIVTNGATEVTALGGDDRICVTGKRHPWIAVDVGAGNDVVDGQHRPGQPVFADLGTGTDVFVGGDDDDRVTLTYPDAGGGTDTVTGGDGDDTIQLQTGPGDARVDNALGTFSSSGSALARWSGVEEFWLAEPPSPRTLTFVGSRGRDTVVDDARTPGVVHVTLDVGADAYRSRTAPLPGSSISGGVGTDLIEVASPSSGLELDLERQRMVVDDGTPYTVSTTDVEDANLFARRVLLKGDSGSNELGFTACRAVVKGREGSDTVRREHDGIFDTDLDCQESARIHGGPGKDALSGTRGADVILGNDGRDVLRGGNGADKLFGGRGRDTADGGQGRDRCLA